MKRNFGKLIIKNGKWKLYDVPPHVCIKLKDIFPKIKRSQTEPFFFEISPEICEDLRWFTSRYPMIMTKKGRRILNRKSENYRIECEDRFKILSGNYKSNSIIKFNEGKAPREFQKLAVDLFLKVKKLLVADATGLGKTVTALASIVALRKLPALIVVKPTLIDQWKERVEEFTDLKAYCIINGTTPIPTGYDIYIIKYTLIFKWVDYLVKMGFKVIIFDEIQEIRRRESSKHQGCLTLSTYIDYRLGLSATPTHNYGIEAFHVFNVLNPNLFPNFSEFCREWTTGFKGAIKDPVALGSYLKENFAYIRRTKEDVKSQIPAFNKIVHTVDSDSREINKVQDEAKTLARTLLDNENYVTRGNAAKQLSVLIRKATGVGKARYVAEYVKIILDNGEKVLLSGWHRDVFSIWLEEFKDYNPVMYTGSETTKQKNNSVKEFCHGDSQVMIISNRSGEGLDGLQKYCSYIVIGELEYNDAVHEQLIGRLYREGQEEIVNAIFLVSNSGSDPLVVDIIGIKKNQFKGIFDLGKSKDKATRDDSIIKSFARNLLNRK